jgi:oxygen-independent coproporphyrinogen-3 oxidase
MPVENTETLSVEQLKLEALFLGLRTKAGIDLKRYKISYGVDLLVDKKTIIDALIKNKFVELKDGFLRPTRTGMAVADSLALI